MLKLRQKVLPVGTTDGKTTSVKFSPNGEFIAIVDGMEILIYELSTQKFVNSVYTSHIKPISDICWSPDSQCISSASDDFSIEIIHISYGQLYRLMSHTAPVISLCYNSKGNLLCSASMDESIKIWDTLNGKLLRTISAHSEAVVSIDIPQFDSSILSSGSYDGLIRIFDIATGHCLKTLTYDKDWKRETGVVPISQIKFSRNGKFLLVKSLDGVVKIWDCVRGYVVRTFNATSDESRYQMHFSCGMGFLYPKEDDSSAIVVSGYEDGEIYCWNASNKELLYVLKDDAYHKGSPIISIDCYDDIVCSLSLNGECYLWNWNS